MLFNSWVYIVFLPLVLLLYLGLPRRAQNLLLLGASYLFYGFWDARFLLLILFSTTLDFVVARLMESTEAPRVRKRLVTLSIVVNLTLLGFFKYFHFFVDSAIVLADRFGMTLSEPTLQVVLPIGISFYTFQTLSYSVDVYCRKVAAERDFFDFALFVCFFPQLVAGPIERASALMPQLKGQRQVRMEDLRIGAWLLLKGYFLKVVIADNLGVVVDQAYDGYGKMDGAVALAATYAFTLQVYGDFAGYSSIARGSARLLGIRLTLNFNLPFLSKSPAEFWRRWHISLSSWLRDYLYIPLGGSREGIWRTSAALLATMALSGLWHGAAWTFVVWGFLHGFWLVGHRFARRAWKSWMPYGPVTSAVGMLLTFHFFCFALVLFRARDLTQAGTMYTYMLHGPWPAGRELVTILSPLLLFGALMWIVDLWTGSRDDPHDVPGWRWGGPILVTAILWMLAVLAPTGSENFVYFQF